MPDQLRRDESSKVLCDGSYRQNTNQAPSARGGHSRQFERGGTVHEPTSTSRTCRSCAPAAFPALMRPSAGRSMARQPALKVMGRAYSEPPLRKNRSLGRLEPMTTRAGAVCTSHANERRTPKSPAPASYPRLRPEPHPIGKGAKEPRFEFHPRVTRNSCLRLSAAPPSVSDTGSPVSARASTPRDIFLAAAACDSLGCLPGLPPRSPAVGQQPQEGYESDRRCPPGCNGAVRRPARSCSFEQCTVRIRPPVWGRSSHGRGALLPWLPGLVRQVMETSEPRAPAGQRRGLSEPVPWARDPTHC